MNKELHDELLRMFTEDQQARQAFVQNMQDPELQKRVVEIDRRNTARLQEIIDAHGWPTKSLVGEDGAGAAFLIVQHADLDRAFQKKCLKLMEAVAEDHPEEVYREGVAYLTDRLLMAEGKLQRFGTQFLMDQQNKRLFIYPSEDPDSLDERRAAYKLPPMSEYITVAKETYGIKEVITLTEDDLKALRQVPQSEP